MAIKGKGEYQPDVPPQTLRSYSPDYGSQVKSTASAPDLLGAADQCTAIGFDWAGLACAYLAWKSNPDRSGTFVFKGQEFQGDLVPRICTILPHAIRDGSLQKFTDYLVTKNIVSVECISPDPLSPKRILRLHSNGKIYTLRDEEGQVNNGASQTP